MNVWTYLKGKLKKGFVLNIFGLSVHVSVKKGRRETPVHSPQQSDVFSNDFRFNMFVETNLNMEVKRNIIAQTFYKNVGYYPNINEPNTFSEKVLWLKLYYDDPKISIACDKANGKEYIDQILGPGYTVPIIKRYSNVFDIDLDELPDRFAIKVNWATGCNIIVQDKTKLDINWVRATLDRWMLPWKSSYYGTFNRGYRDTKPILFVEEYLDIPKNSTEYKVFCFHGRAKFTLVELDYFGNHPRRAYYDREWKEVPYRFGNIEKTTLGKMPETYPEIIRLAEKLADPFPYIRVDFYDIHGRLYVGELTFYSGGGFSPLLPIEWDHQLGQELDLTQAMNDVGSQALTNP